MRHIASVFALTLCAVCSFAQAVFAERAPLPDDVRGAVNSNISNAINGVIIFSSTSAVGSGYFKFESEDDSPDTSVDVLRVNGEYKLRSLGGERGVPFLHGGLGHFHLSEQSIPIDGGGENDFSTITNDGVTLGGGVEYRATNGLFISPAFDFVYSHTKNHYDFNNPFSVENLKPYDRDVFNWDIDSMTYIPGITARYEVMAGSTMLIPSVSYMQSYVDGVRTDSRILNVSTSTGVLNTRLKADIPSGYSLNSSAISVVPQVSRTDIYGDARAGIGIGHFHELSLALIAKQQNFLPLFTNFGISGGYTFGEDMAGWRVGLEAEF